MKNVKVIILIWVGMFITVAALVGCAKSKEPQVVRVEGSDKEMLELSVLVNYELMPLLRKAGLEHLVSEGAIIKCDEQGQMILDNDEKTKLTFSTSFENGMSSGLRERVT